jgi:predicted 3-demethylubiquinone-9 3-methyltransferase (glyoxalase superfamily)
MNPQSFSPYFYEDKFGLGFRIIVQELGVIIHSMITIFQALELLRKTKVEFVAINW